MYALTDNRNVKRYTVYALTDSRNVKRYTMYALSVILVA